MSLASRQGGRRRFCDLLRVLEPGFFDLYPTFTKA